MYTSLGSTKPHADAIATGNQDGKRLLEGSLVERLHGVKLLQKTHGEIRSLQKREMLTGADARTAAKRDVLKSCTVSVCKFGE